MSHKNESGLELDYIFQDMFIDRGTPFHWIWIPTITRNDYGT